MTVRVTGQPTKCCRKGNCLNRSIFDWDIFSEDTAGSVSRSGDAQVITANPGGFEVLYDSQNLVSPMKDFCLNTTFKVSGGFPSIGLASIAHHFQSYLVIENGGSGNWVIAWTAGGEVTIYDLGIAFDTTQHTIRICRKGGQLGVFIDHNKPLTFNIDGNFPVQLLAPEAYAFNDSSTTLYSFCVEAKVPK